VDRVESEKITNVRIFPFVPHEEYSDLLASADVSLVTLEPGMEGICVPSKFYSILASARPTIAMVGESCEVARVIQEAGCGVQIEQRDVNGLVDAICSLKDNPLDVDLMGANARDVLLEKFSTALLSDKYYRAFAMASGSGSVDPHVGTDRDFAWAVHSKDSNNGARKSSASKETAEAELVPDKL
jgi:glycosyltransferase involved in cell wall biosynthesis